MIWPPILDLFANLLAIFTVTRTHGSKLNSFYFYIAKNMGYAITSINFEF